MTGTLYIIAYTSSIPSSVTYTLEVFDKYVSGSDYGRSVAISSSFANVATGFNVVQPTKFMWRRMVYK